MENEKEDLRRRLARIEGEMTRLRRRAGAARLAALLGLGVLVTVVGIRPAETQRREWRGTRIQAPFVVTDRQGLAIMQVEATGTGGILTLFDRRGNVAAVLGTTPEGRGLQLWDPYGRRAVDLGSDLPGERRGVVIGNRAGRPVAELLAAPDAGELTLRDNHGEILLLEPAK